VNFSVSSIGLESHISIEMAGSAAATSSEVDICALVAKEQRDMAQNPYRLMPRLELARLYEKLEYHDLAVGESYRAILLIDEILDETGEYHASALEAAMVEHRQNGLSTISTQQSDADASGSGEIEEILEVEDTCSWVRKGHLLTAYVSTSSIFIRLFNMI
jgi:hypothetical protein